MEKGSYFDSYNDYINELKNRLLRIQLKYIEIQSLARYGYDNGELNEEQYERVINGRIDVFIPGVVSQYCLSKAEVDFVREYVDLNANGELMETMLKPELLDKQDKLNRIFNSVTRFAYYESFDGITKRSKLKEEFDKRFGAERAKCLEQIKRIKETRGDDYQHSLLYQRENERLEVANRALRLADSIITLDDDGFIKLVEQFYEIEYSYYEWYKKMSLKEEFDNGFIYDEHLELMKKNSNNLRDLRSKREMLEEEEEEAKKVSQVLIDFLMEMAEFQIPINNPNDKKSIFHKREVKDNRGFLFEIFKKFTLLNGTYDYIINNLVVSDNPQNHFYDAREAFDSYFKTVYGDEVTFVLEIDFVNEFRRLVTSYYKTVIEQYNSSIKDDKKEIEMADGELLSGNGKALGQAQVINDIYQGYTGEESILIPGFSRGELEEIYQSLKCFIVENIVYGEDLGKPKK